MRIIPAWFCNVPPQAQLDATMDANDDVIYLGTIARTRQEVLAPSIARSRRQREPRSHPNPRAVPSKHLQRAQSGNKSSCTRRQQGRTRGVVPANARSKLVEVGHVKDSTGIRHKVYAYFNRRSRFYHQIGRLLGAKRISHRVVEYHPLFQGYSREEVKAAVLSRLDTKFGPFLDDGEA
ncbi:uncharacterized protein PG998_014690 [Apiospora kogelbergensis]|uniref:uncharacterized protein n=1 Tax=Apiospora kogelbergensis TaxID=1337665 RepID=UPI0031311A83